MSRILPVTLITGSLGAGKTTLLNRMIAGSPDLRTAVIENEFGDISVDDRFLIFSEEELTQVNTSQSHTTVRGDLLRVLNRLSQVSDKFDRVLIESTGLTDPGPAAQTFFTDEAIKQQFRLESIVTVVDAKHAPQAVEETDMFRRQVAFADVVLVNKSDLVSGAELDALEKRLRTINSIARIYRTRHSDIHLGELSLAPGFSLTRAQQLDPHFLKPEYPFRWAGVFPLAAEGAELWLEEPQQEDTAIVMIPVRSTHGTSLADAREAAALAFSDADAPSLPPGSLVVPGGTLQRLVARGPLTRYRLHMPVRGLYALFLSHNPKQIRTTVRIDGIPIMPRWERTFHPRHHHPQEVVSVGLKVPGEVDVERAHRWLNDLHLNCAGTLLRTKGVLTVSGTRQRMLVNGVQDHIETYFDLAWKPDDQQINFLIFIGHGLDRLQLLAGLRSCLTADPVLEAQSA